MTADRSIDSLYVYAYRHLGHRSINGETFCQVLRHFVLEQWQGPPLREKTSFVVLPAEDVKISLKPRPNAK